MKFENLFYYFIDNYLTMICILTFSSFIYAIYLSIVKKRIQQSHLSSFCFLLVYIKGNSYQIV